MSDEASQKLADLLRQAREYLGISQGRAAEELGIPRPAVSQIENGNRRVSALELAKLARLYQRPVGYFTGEVEKGDTSQIELLKRAATELSEQDRDEVLRFAEYLLNRRRGGDSE